MVVVQVKLATQTETFAQMRSRGAFSSVAGAFTFRDAAGSIIDEETPAIGYARSTAGVGLLGNGEDWTMLHRALTMKTPTGELTGKQR